MSQIGKHSEEERRIVVYVNLQGKLSHFRISVDDVKPRKVLEECFRKFSMVSEMGKCKTFLLNPRTFFYECIAQDEFDHLDLKKYIFKKDDSLQLDVRIDPLVIYDEASMISHPWIETKNTDFTTQDILEMTKDEFRYFVFGSRNCSQIIIRMFEMCPVPPQLLECVLEYLYESGQMDLVERITDIRDIFALNFLLQVEPAIFEKKFLMNFSEFCEKEEYHLFLERLFHQKIGQWSSSFFSKCFDTLLSEAERNVYIIQSKHIPMIVSSPHISDDQTSRFLEFIRDHELTETVELYDVMLQALEKRTKQIPAESTLSTSHKQEEEEEESSNNNSLILDEPRRKLIRRFFKFVDRNTRDEEEGELSDIDSFSYGDDDDDDDLTDSDSDDDTEGLEEQLRSIFSNQYEELKKMISSSPGMFPVMVSIFEQKIPELKTNHQKRRELYRLFGISMDGDDNNNSDDNNSNTVNNVSQRQQRKNEEEDEEEKKKRILVTRKQLRVMMQRLLQTSIIPQYYLPFIKKMIDQYANAQSGFFTESEMIEMLARNPNVNDGELLAEFKRNTTVVKILCKTRKRIGSLSEAAKAQIPEFISLIDGEYNSYYYRADFYDSLFASILSNPNVELEEAVEIKIANFSLELYLEDNSNICSCSMELAKKTKNKEIVSLLLALDVLTRRTIARRCENLENDQREQLLKDDDQEVKNITMACHPEVRYQKIIFDQYSQNPNTYDSGFLLSVLSGNKHLDKEIMKALTEINCERDFFFKREIAKRGDLTEEIVLVLMKCYDIDVYENLSRNRKSQLTPQVIDLVGNFTHRMEELKLFYPSLRKIHSEGVNDRGTFNELLSSYQSQFRMNLLSSQKERILEATLRIFLEDADFGVISAIIENIPLINEQMVNTIVERKANSQTIRDDLMKQLIDRYLLSENVRNDENIPICLFDYSDHVAVHILKVIESKSLVFPNIHPALELMIQSFRNSRKVMIQMRSLLLHFLKRQLLRQGELSEEEEEEEEEEAELPGLEDLFLLFLSNICVDIDVVSYCIPFLKSDKLLRCIVKRTDVTGVDLWKIYLKQISKSNNRGFTGPVLLDIASKGSSLPEDLKWSLCLLHSKLGKYSVYQIADFESHHHQQQQEKEMEIMKNELFEIFLRGDTMLNENILKYYITFESSSVVPLLHSSLLDTSLINYFFEKVFPRYSQLLDAPTTKYINQFLRSIRQLTGEESIQLHDLKNLNSSTIKKTINYSKYGVKLGDLPKFIVEIGLSENISKRIELFMKPFSILFDDDDDENITENQDGGNDQDDIYGTSKPSDFVQASVVKVKNFEETKKGLCDLLLSSNIAMLGFIEKFVKEEIFKYSYDRELERFVEVHEKYQLILDVDEFQVKFNKMLYEHLTTIFSQNLMKKRDLSERQFYRLLDSSRYTVRGVFLTLKNLNVIDEEQTKVLTLLTEKGIRMDQVSNVTHLVNIFSDESQGLGSFLRGIDRDNNSDCPEFEVVEEVAAVVSPTRKKEEEEGSEIDSSEVIKEEEEPLVVSTTTNLPKNYLDLSDTSDLPSFQQYYRFFECFPFFCNQTYPKRLLNLVKFWGRPDPGTASSLGFYLNETKKFLDLMELEGPELLKGIIHSRDMIFKGNQIMYSHHYLEDKKHLCNCIPFERAIKETIFKTTNKLVIKMNQFLRSELEHLVILRLESKLLETRGKQQYQREDVFDSLDIYTPSMLNEICKSMVICEKQGFSMKDYVSGDLMKFLELIYPFRKIINVRFLRYKNQTNRVRNCGIPNIVFRMYEYFTNTQRSFSYNNSSGLTKNNGSEGGEVVEELSETVAEYQISEFLYHLERSEMVNTILQKINTASKSLSHNDVVRLFGECKWETDDPLLFSSYLYLSGDSNMIRKQITPVLQAQIQTEILRKSEENLKLLIQQCESCTLLTQPDPDGRMQSIVAYEPVQNGAIALQHPYLLDENSQCQIDPDNPTQYLRDYAKPKTMLPVEYVEKKVQKVPMMIEIRHTFTSSSSMQDNKNDDDDEFREKVSLIDSKIMLERLNMTLVEEIERYFKIVITTLNVESLDKSIEKFKRIVREGIEVENPQTRKKYLVKPSENFFMAKIDQLLRIEKMDDPVKIIQNFEYIKSQLLPREMIQLIEMIQLFSIRNDEQELSKVEEEVEEDGEGETERKKKKKKVLSTNDLKAKLFEIGFVIEIMKKEVCYHSLLLSSAKRSQYYLRAVFHHLSSSIYPRLKSIQQTKKNGTILMVFRISNEGDYLFISSHYAPNSREWFNYIHYNNNVCADTDFRKSRDFVRTGIFPIKILEGFYLLETVQDLFDEEFVFYFSKRRIERIRSRTHHDVIRNIQSGDVAYELGEESGRTIGTVNWTSKKLNHFQKEAALCNASPFVDFKFDESRECIVLRKDENELKRELMEIDEMWNN